MVRCVKIENMQEYIKYQNEVESHKQCIKYIMERKDQRDRKLMLIIGTESFEFTGAVKMDIIDDIVDSLEFRIHELDDKMLELTAEAE